MILRLLIDGVYADLEQKTGVAITAGIADIEEPDSSSSGFTKSVELPFTPRNLRIFGYTNEPYSKEKFNNGLHTAEYMADDITVMRGTAQIEKITCKTGGRGQVIGGSFHVTAIGAAFEWVSNAKKRMDELEGGEVVKYTIDDVYANSIREDASLIKFFPVDRGAFYEEKGDEVLPRKALDLYDFHPFLNTWKLMRFIFGKFNVKSSLQGLLEQIYCSGYMPKTDDVSYLKEDNDFCCGTTLQGNTKWINPLDRPTINLFDQWTSDDGKYFVATDGILENAPSANEYTVFKPTGDVPVSFKVRIKYLSGIGFKGAYIDTIKIGNTGDDFKFGLFEWDSVEGAKNSLNACEAGVTYAIYLKMNDHTKYKSLHYVVSMSPGGYDEIIIGNINASKMCGMVTKSHISAANHRLCLKDEWGVMIPVEALATTGSVEIEIMPIMSESAGFYFEKDITTKSRTLRKDEKFPLFIGLSATNGWKGEVYAITFGDCSIAPSFRDIIGKGDDVGISTVGGTSTQLDFLASLRQMFNLMFYTNPITREVFVEPRTRFYNINRGDIIDWRDKIDYSREITVEELGGDIGNSLKLAYTEGSEVVKRYNWKYYTEIGAYEVPLTNKTTDEPKEIINPIFAPFILRSVESVGMTMPQNESEKAQDTIDDVELDITPIIGYFAGVASRTAGDDRSIYPQYPRLVFQDASNHINLGFGDVSGSPGLHQYYDDNISAYNNGRRITAYIRLAPQDVEAIQTPNDLMADFRSVYMLSIDGEDLPCLLESITDYNPASGASTKCQFILDPNLKLTGKVPVVITYNGAVVTRNDAVIIHNSKNVD